MNDNIEIRVEKHTIRKSNKYYSMLENYCHLAKNLYNHANYIIRKEFNDTGLYIGYAKLDKILKADTIYTDYSMMPSAQSAQQTLRAIDKDWKSFFKLNKAYKSGKIKGRPKPPKYADKNGFKPLFLTNQVCKLSDGIIRFPKTFNGFTVKTKCHLMPNYKSFQQIRIHKHNSSIIIEVIYRVNMSEMKHYNGRVIGVDIGVNNLMAVSNNCHLPVFIINGKPLKSINQFYNKQIAHYSSICNTINNKHKTKRINRITEKRNRKINDYMHKASRFLVNYCADNNITKIIIGKNIEWKQGCNLGKVTNQNLIQIPFARLIEMIEYKAKDLGITVVTTEESYTSGTSFIDDELPTVKFYDKSRRKHRGLFISNSGVTINADINGAYQIIKKEVPIKWDRGCVAHPFIITV